MPQPSEQTLYRADENMLQSKGDLSEFARDTIRGLSASPKYLMSKYFYDDRGSRIFQTIMNMPEYYPTDCEFDIFNTHSKKLEQCFFADHETIDLVELGAGDGAKTQVLLNQFLQSERSFSYIPIDISAKAVQELVTDLEQKFPDLAVYDKVGDYFKMMHELNIYDKNPKVILFLGSNIGNYGVEERSAFFQRLADVMNQTDRLLIGFDLKKDPSVILRAYDDPHGHTKEFNLNLLSRINRELDGNFIPEHFEHYATYDPQTGTAKSYLISTRKQSAFIFNGEYRFSFDRWEPVFVEMSQKYDYSMIETMADQHGFEIIGNWYDRYHYFVNSVWKLAD